MARSDELKEIADLWKKKVRARDWPRAVIEEGIEKAGHNPVELMYGHLLAYFHFLDNGELERARDHIRQSYLFARSLSPSRYGYWIESVSLEYAFILGRLGIATQKADEILKSVPLSRTFEAKRRRAEAAILCCKANGLCFRLIERAEASWRKKYPDPVPDTVQAELDWLDDLKEVARSRIGTARHP
ncbi:MAG TPA: hypothetical protein VHE55_06530 [Fimbriimonadaceae bacterium]|nr:hypothetical protein [Fimbriimonadaceae bacterium]